MRGQSHEVSRTRSVAGGAEGDVLQYRIVAAEDGLIVHLEGRMTYADHELCQRLLVQILAARPRSLLFALGQLSFIDSAALGMLLLIRERWGRERANWLAEGEAFVDDPTQDPADDPTQDPADDPGAFIRLRGATDQALRVLTASHFDRFFRIED